jgi:hypothetical protein
MTTQASAPDDAPFALSEVLRASSPDHRISPYPGDVIEVSCEACGWIAITDQPINAVWREHEEGCPAIGGAVRHMPNLPPMPRLLPPVNTCTHRPVRRQIAVTPAGVKKYAVMCELCGRFVD